MSLILPTLIYLSFICWCLLMNTELLQRSLERVRFYHRHRKYSGRYGSGNRGLYKNKNMNNCHWRRMARRKKKTMKQFTLLCVSHTLTKKMFHKLSLCLFSFFGNIKWTNSISEHIILIICLIFRFHCNIDAPKN